MPYNRTRHQELADILNNGLARVAGPQLVDDFTDTSDGAFNRLLDDVLDIIKDRLANGRNSAVVDLLVTPANLIMAGRLVEALEERGLYCSDMRRKSEEFQADYLTFEAILLPLKEEAPAAVEVMEAAGSEPAVITPGTVVYVISSPFSANAIRAEKALTQAGYNVKRCDEEDCDATQTFTRIPRVASLLDAPEKRKICAILSGVFASCVDDIYREKPAPYPNHYYVYICD